MRAGPLERRKEKPQYSPVREFKSPLADGEGRKRNGMTINVTYSHVKLAAVASLVALGVSELYAQSSYLLLGVPVAALFTKISNVALGIGVLMSRQNDQTSEDVKAPNATVEPPKPSGS